MKEIIEKHKKGESVGICSICSAHPLIIKASFAFDLKTNRKVLIESTSNQVNQFGGYTGMKPADFRQFVFNIADEVGFPHERIILGGDHLGPNCWQHESAEEAMQKSDALIAEYVKAGFTKIHLDASMSCANDPVPLPPEEVAKRAARLCKIAEQTATPTQKQQLTYVIGTEVPVPGGESSAINTIHITRSEDVDYTLKTHYAAFKDIGIADAIERIIAIVVQPGVEFDHSQVILYDRDKAKALSHYIESTSLVYEAHSTDYQTKQCFKALVEDHFAILKVGPAVTFALREGIFALAQIEKSIIQPEKCSALLAVIDQVMLDDPKYWKKYYSPIFSQAIIDIHYSLSDRIRYYWPDQRITKSVNQLLSNLSEVTIPLGLISQYFPTQLEPILNKTFETTPQMLLINKIQEVLNQYAFGCGE